MDCWWIGIFCVEIFVALSLVDEHWIPCGNCLVSKQYHCGFFGRGHRELVGKGCASRSAPVCLLMPLGVPVVHSLRPAAYIHHTLVILFVRNCHLWWWLWSVIFACYAEFFPLVRRFLQIFYFPLKDKTESYVLWCRYLRASVVACA